MPNIDRAESDKSIKQITYLGIVVNIALAIIKLAVGLLAGSMSLVADGLHSLSDMVTDVAVILGVHFASREPDKKHPYGHDFIETFATAFIAIVLMTAGGFMIRQAAVSIARQEVSQVTLIMLVAVITSVISKEILYHLTIRVSKKTHSTALYANAWHHRSDAFSSIAVLLGLISIEFGFVYGDQMAASAVGLMVIMVGAKSFGQCYRDFSNHSVDKKTYDKIQSIISTSNGVCDWHKLRTRSVGREIFLDLHILVNPDLNIEQAHDITEEIEESLANSLGRPMNVTIHIEPDKPELRNVKEL